jgi:hypothetical protein
VLQLRVKAAVESVVRTNHSQMEWTVDPAAAQGAYHDADFGAVSTSGD